MRCRRSFVALIVLSGWSAAWGPAGPPAAAPETYVVDPVHSVVLFRIRHLDVSYFHGRFNHVTGRFTFDSTHPGKSSFLIEVASESIDTNNAERDRVLKGEDFFAVDKYPAIRFESQRVEKVGDNRFRVVGDLTLHGVTKSVTVTLERIGAGPDIWGGYRSGFETTFTVRRSEFGIKGFLEPIKGVQTLGDEVRITVAVEGVRKKEPPHP